MEEEVGGFGADLAVGGAPCTYHISNLYPRGESRPGSSCNLFVAEYLGKDKNPIIRFMLKTATHDEIT